MQYMFLYLNVVDGLSDLKIFNPILDPNRFNKSIYGSFCLYPVTFAIEVLGKKNAPFWLLIFV